MPVVGFFWDLLEMPHGRLAIVFPGAFFVWYIVGGVLIKQNCVARVAGILSWSTFIGCQR